MNGFDQANDKSLRSNESKSLVSSIGYLTSRERTKLKKVISDILERKIKEEKNEKVIFN